MSLKLKDLKDQVIVITGASSGIGLSTARMAAEKGARVFMISRNEEELQKLQDEMRNNGHETAYAVADVAEVDQLQVAADLCVKTFGRIDTWINNAGVSIYARLLETDEIEARRLFDTNFWGVVNGSKVAVPYLRKERGALINIGSVLSSVSLPIQGLYSASKHAVKGYTDALRRELLAEKAPISVSLVMPGAIDTPYPEHAGDHIGEPVHTPPVYNAETVAKFILKCAETPTREIGVGASAYLYPFLDRFFPKVQDFIMSRGLMEDSQRKSSRLPDNRSHGEEGALFEPPEKEGKVKGNYPGHVMKSSMVSEIASRSSWFSSSLMALGGATLLLLKKKAKAS